MKQQAPEVVRAAKVSSALRCLYKASERLREAAEADPNSSEVRSLGIASQVVAALADAVGGDKGRVAAVGLHGQQFSDCGKEGA